jgi:hypothetical protein
MTDPTNRPLWQVMDIAMEQALEKDDQCHERFMYAAELRAIARWIESHEPLSYDMGYYYLEIAGKLMTEAARAEAGE